MNSTILILLFYLLSASHSNQAVKQFSSEWILSDFVEKHTEGVQLKGNPGIVDFGSRKAVSFNGSSDAIFLEKMPLTGCEQFTIEVIFRPAVGGNFAQRFLHFGEVQGDRVLMELRSKKEGWYLDAFIKTSSGNKTLIDSTLIHPTDQWYHIAYVIDHGKLSTYVNHKKELEGIIEMTPVNRGKTSIGVRQNETYWFKGDIFKIRITPEALKPENFIQK